MLAFLVALSLWPIAHHAMVTAYDMDPWRLLGFSMYAAPKPYVKVRMVDLSWAPETPQEQRELSNEVGRAFDARIKELQMGTQTLGRLYPWRSCFAGMFDVLPDEVGKVRVLMSRRIMDSDAILTSSPIVMECLRPRDGEEIECRTPEARFRVAASVASG